MANAQLGQRLLNTFLDSGFPMDFRAAARDIQAFPREWQTHDLSYFLDGIPPTLGGVTESLSLGAISLNTLRFARFSSPGAETLGGGKQFSAGVADEAAWLADIGGTKNTALWRPSAADIDSAAFHVVVGPAKYTASGQPLGTIFDISERELIEFKSGSTSLDSSYQLRLQTYRALTTDTPYSIVTTRPVNPSFSQWLDRWGVTVVAPK